MQTPATPPPADGPTDEAWLAEVFRQHQASLTTYAFQILGDLESARDAVQDTFMRLCEAEAVPLRDHLTVWLFTVCRRRALDFLRKGKRMQPLTEDEAAHRSDEGPSPAETTEIRDGGRSYAQASTEFKFAAAVATYGLIVNQSAHRGNATLSAVAELAGEALGADPWGYRREFLDLVAKTRALRPNWP